ncbi:universal stress protein [Bisbaumannia pacifica]|uniref:Universal stress protein n=1 Tax=Bisbaumannia pacifica TaxID=77098 RepID=A0ABD4L7Y1_9GAMM|nr:universal stress protein [Halomonas pacifica]MBH8581930.1 universal stress protein [Halomonas pacifica]
MSHGIKRILCCVGLRGDCDRVIQHAAGLALATGAELHILHAVKSLSDDVVNTLKVNIRDRKVLGTLMEQRLEQAREELDTRLETFWMRHPELRDALGDAQIGRTVLEGYPASVITHFAMRGGYDMIVLAANKRSFVAAYAGKITKGVIKRARVPVVVVPNRDG